MKKMANSQSTRARVANTVASLKAVGEAAADVKTKMLWKDAPDNVFEFADKDENRDMEE